LEGRQSVAGADSFSQGKTTRCSTKPSIGSSRVPANLSCANAKGWAKTSKTANQPNPRTPHIEGMLTRVSLPRMVSKLTKRQILASPPSLESAALEGNQELVTSGYFGALTNRVNLIS